MAISPCPIVLKTVGITSFCFPSPIRRLVSVLADASIPSLLVICCASIAMSFGIPLFEAVSGTGNTTNALILESVVLIAYTFSVWFFASYISTRVEWVWTSEFTYGTLIGLVSWLFMRFASWQRKKI